MSIRFSILLLACTMNLYSQNPYCRAYTFEEFGDIINMDIPGNIRGTSGPGHIAIDLKVSNSDIDALLENYRNDIDWRGLHNDECTYLINESNIFYLDEFQSCTDIIPLPRFVDEIRSIDPETRDWLLPDDFTIYLLEYSNLKEPLVNGNILTEGFAVSKERGLFFYWKREVRL